MNWKSQHTNLPKGNGNAAGWSFSGYNSHRGGNCIKALHFLSSQRTARLMRNVMRLASSLHSTALSSVSFMVFGVGSAQRGVSKEEGGTL